MLGKLVHSQVWSVKETWWINRFWVKFQVWSVKETWWEVWDVKESKWMQLVSALLDLRLALLDLQLIFDRSASG